MADIIFKEGIKCIADTQYAGAYTQTIIGNDLSSDFKIAEGQEIIETVNYGTNSLITSFRYQSHETHSGTYGVHFPGVFNYTVANTLYTNGATIPFYIPLVVVPFGNDYLIAAINITSRNYSSYSGVTSYAYNLKIYWSNKADINIATTRTVAVDLGAGSVDSTSYIREVGCVASILKNVAFWGGATTVNLPPLDEMAIKFDAVIQDGQHIQLDMVRNYSSNSGGTLNFASLFGITRAILDGHGDPTWTDGSEEAGPASGPGGMSGGSFDYSSDTIGIPTSPSIGTTTTGFVRAYNVGTSALVGLGGELFPQLTYNAPTPISSGDTTDAIIDGFNSMVTFFANIPSLIEQMTANTLIQYILDVHVIPVSPGSGTSEYIKVGHKTLSISGGRLYTDYVDVPCGSINMAEFYTNFADFSLTNAKLFLPFVGFVPVRPEWWQSTNLYVDYKFNIVDGSFCCYVRSGGKYVNNGGGGTIVGQYAGVACMHLPITGVSYASMVSGLVGAAGGMVSSAGSGNIAAAATSLIDATQAHGDIPNSNAYSGSAAFLSCRVPFLMIERPVSSYSKNYQHEMGIPSNIYAKLGDVGGFLTMENVHLDGIDLTQAEKDELQSLLASGVIN